MKHLKMLAITAMAVVFATAAVAQSAQYQCLSERASPWPTGIRPQRQLFLYV